MLSCKPIKPYGLLILRHFYRGLFESLESTMQYRVAIWLNGRKPIGQINRFRKEIDGKDEHVIRTPSQKFTLIASQPINRQQAEQLFDAWTRR
jgi:hypothetical protein